MDKITFRSPDDLHGHFRQGKTLKDVLPETAKVFKRGIAMGNLPEPVVTTEDAKRYREEILEVDPNFEPIMTVMLTKKTAPEMLEKAHEAGVRILKWIPGATSTNSDTGVAFSELENYYAVLKKAEELGMVFSGHWEKAADDNGKEIPDIEREEQAIPNLEKLVKDFPGLKIVVEHASTKKMIEFVSLAPSNVAATLTYHHASITFDDVYDSSGKLNPHHYCKPIAKREEDRRAVIEAMVSGNPKFFFGSDSAPHPIEKKESENPPAGIFSAPVILPGLAEIFEKEGKLDRLEDFVSRFGAEFYGLPLNEGTVTLVREEYVAPKMIGSVKVFQGGEKKSWKIKT